MMKKVLISILFSLCLLSSAALAAEAPALVATHGDWNVYSFTENGDKSCFMSSQPKKQEGKYKKRGEVFIFITRWSNGADKNVVSISNGYTFKKGSTVSIKIDKKVFKMYTQGEMAWTKDQKADNALTESIKKGKTLVVEGVSQTGTHTTDTYGLKGSVDALKSLVDACK